MNDSYSVRSTLESDDDQDFASFIANRRSHRSANYVTKNDISGLYKPDAENIDSIPTDQQTSSGPMKTRSWLRPKPAQLVTEDSTDTALPGIGLQPSRHNDLSDQANVGWNLQSPAQQTLDHPNSPLFITDESPMSRMTTTSIAKIPRRMLTRDFQLHSPTRPPSHISHHRLEPLATLKDEVDQSVRHITREDAFARKTYIDKLKANPYTSGIFVSEGYSGALLTGFESSVLPIHLGRRSCRGQLLESMQQRPRLIQEGASLSASVRDEQGSSSKKRRREEDSRIAISIALEQESTPFISRSALSKEQQKQQQQQQRKKKTDTLTLQAQHRGTTVKPCSPKSAVKAFLSSTAQDCKEALEKVDSTNARDGELCHLIKRQVQPDIDRFAQLLEGQPDVDAEGFRQSIEEWNLDLEKQILLRKRIVYDSLMEVLTRREQ